MNIEKKLDRGMVKVATKSFKEYLLHIWRNSWSCRVVQNEQKVGADANQDPVLKRPEEAADECDRRGNEVHLCSDK